jgi:ethanolamine utilization protein EutQ (cupin superfamily)
MFPRRLDKCDEGEETVAIRKLENAFSFDITDLNMPGIKAYMSDLASGENAGAPITCGLFKQEAGNPCPYVYETEEFKILLDGEMSVTNEDGEKFDLKPGEIIYFGKGEKVNFSSNSSGLAFYVAQR